MRYHIRRARAFAVFVVAVSLLFSTGAALGTTFEHVGPVLFGDDNHYASVSPFAAVAVSSIPTSPPGQCAWINTGLDAFKAANPANGSGPSGAAWNFTWAGAADEAKVEAGITISDYFPFVVNVPAITAGDGTNYPAVGPGELGGAVFNLKYTKPANAPAINNLHWIQGYTGTLYGSAFGPFLDNDPTQPYSGQSNVSPFYDTNYAAGTLAGGGGWFLDRPRVPENEYESNPVVSGQFQVILAGDTTSVVGGVTQHNVTLYGGYWWGYTYSAIDVPEPACLGVLCIVAFAVITNRRSLGGSK